jgi:hypothetical protein
MQSPPRLACFANVSGKYKICFQNASKNVAHEFSMRRTRLMPNLVKVLHCSRAHPTQTIILESEAKQQSPYPTEPTNSSSFARDHVEALPQDHYLLQNETRRTWFPELQTQLLKTSASAQLYTGSIKHRRRILPLLARYHVSASSPRRQWDADARRDPACERSQVGKSTCTQTLVSCRKRKRPWH